MKDLRKFRLINKSEEDIIHTSLLQINENLVNFLQESQYKLYISLEKLDNKKNYPLIFLVNDEVSKLTEQIDKKIISAGLYMGFMKKGNFNLSLEGADFFYQQDLFSESQIIQVTKEGEKSILYGNKVLKKMVEKVPSNLKENQFILFRNSFKELISIGISQIGFSELDNLNASDIIALNLVDKGYYLRRQNR